MIVLAISCTIAVQKLGAERISCPSFTHSFPDMIGELMDVLLGLVSMDKLHKFASKAGFEHEFLAHFGSNVLLYHDTSCEVVFWVSMAWRKLIFAFLKVDIVWFSFFLFFFLSFFLFFLPLFLSENTVTNLRKTE